MMDSPDLDFIRARLQQNYSPISEERLKALRLWPQCVVDTIIEILTETDSLKLDEESFSRRQQALNAFKLERWGNALDDLFLKYRSRLEQATFSLIRLKDPQFAQELYYRLIEKEISFEDAAVQYSLAADAWCGGRLGPQVLAQTNPALCKFIQSAALHVPQPPFQIAEWVLILRVDARLAATYNERVKDQLLDFAFSDWLAEIQSEITNKP